MTTVDPTKPIHTPLSTAEEIRKGWEEYRLPSPYITTTSDTSLTTAEQLEEYMRIYGAKTSPSGGIAYKPYPGGTYGGIEPTAKKPSLIIRKYGATFTVEEIRGKLRCTARLCHDGCGDIVVYGPDDKPENAILAGIEKLTDAIPEWGEMVSKLVVNQIKAQPEKEEEEEHYAGIKSLYEPLPLGAMGAAVKALYDEECAKYPVDWRGIYGSSGT